MEVQWKMNTLNKNNSNNEQNFQEPDNKNKKGKKFYIALAICLTAISAAAWSTYKSVKDFIVPSKSESKFKNHSQTSNKTIPQNQDKNSILDKKSPDKKPTLNKRQPIPYDKPQNNEQQSSENNSEETQPVSAQTSESPIVYPAGNHIIKEFSDGKPMYSKTMNDWRSHNGTDFSATTGSTVKSITDGVVKDIYVDSSYGMTVKVEHDSGFTAYYSGLGETVLVKKDEKLTSGQEIGSVAKIPCEIADESHVHISIYKDGKFIDPLLILEKEN